MELKRRKAEESGHHVEGGGGVLLLWWWVDAIINYVLCGFTIAKHCTEPVPLRAMGCEPVAFNGHR